MNVPTEGRYLHDSIRSTGILTECHDNQVSGRIIQRDSCWKTMIIAVCDRVDSRIVY